MADSPVTDDQFKAAVQRLAAADETFLASERTRLNARSPKGYYVDLPDRRLSLKLVIRSAYDAAGHEWDHPQSREVFDRFKHLDAGFKLAHEPKPRSLTGSELEQEEELERKYVERLSRPEQAAFRTALLAKNPVCHLTGCAVTAALEAAHVRPVSKKGSFTVDNGMLLRADLHRLFDFGFLAFDPSDGSAWLHSSCEDDYPYLAVKELAESDRRRWHQALLARWADKKR
jgi:hypothetical protein